jgi:hypothetical protein
MCELASFRFRPGEWKLFGSVLNEVVNGFAVRDFDHTIGVDSTSAAALLKRLHTLGDSQELDLNPSEARTVRNALRESVFELGIDEFHTRTGYELEEGESILARLDRLLDNE